MVVDCKYNIGQWVYLKTDTEQLKRMVTAILISPNGITYELSCGSETRSFYEIEISEEKDVLIKT